LRGVNVKGRCKAQRGRASVSNLKYQLAWFLCIWPQRRGLGTRAIVVALSFPAAHHHEGPKLLTAVQKPLLLLLHIVVAVMSVLLIAKARGRAVRRGLKGGHGLLHSGKQGRQVVPGLAGCG